MCSTHGSAQARSESRGQQCLSQRESTELRACRFLRRVDLSHNELTELTGLESLPDLQARTLSRIETSQDP